MLELMRKFSQTFVVKLLLFILALAFVIWGIGDVLRHSNKQTVATVAGRDISYTQYHQMLEQYVAQLREMYGNQFGVEHLQQMGMDREILERMIGDQLLEKRVEDLHVGVGDDIVQALVMTNENFFNPEGKFDADLFARILHKNGMTEQRYITALHKQQGARLFLSAFISPPLVADMQIRPLFAHRYEQREADVLVLTAEGEAITGDPTDTQLVQFYNDHAGQFVVPELREVSYIQFDQKVISGIDPVGDDAVAVEYENRKSDFVVGAMWVLDQYVYDNEETAKQTYEALLRHEEVKGRVTLGSVSRESLPAELQEQVFALKKGEMSKPIKSPLGWHIFIVNDVLPETVKPLEAVKEQLRQELMEARHADAFYQWMSGVENDLSSGMNLEEVAKKFNLTIHRLEAMDARGIDEKGQKIKDLPDPGIFLPLVFKLDASTESGVTVLSDNQTYVSVRVDKVMPSRSKALDEVKGYATQLWKEEEQSKKLRTTAEQLARQLQTDKTTIEEAAHGAGIKFYPAKMVKRSDNPPLNSTKKQIYPADWLEQLFTLKTGETTNAYIMSDGSYVIGNVRAVVQADKNKEAGLANVVRDHLAKDYVDEIMAQYMNYLKTIYKVERNETLLQMRTTSDAQ